jgi:N-acetyl sugar amidotransferase
MDTTAGDISFNEKGVCNFCSAFINSLEKNQAIAVEERIQRDDFIAEVKASGKGKRYDCIVGVSGGVDSSYALFLAVKNGLHPLAVHLDNGWDSELAVYNISSLVKKLNVDLYTHVIDWPENRDLQRAFFMANVVDIEMLVDNALQALNYQQAEKYRLKYILSGSNLSTEGLTMPPKWNHFKLDERNIRCIHRRFGTLPIKTHPLISTAKYIWYEFVRGIKWVAFLNYFPYNKSEALRALKEEVGYKPYPYKHYESTFTRFYQAYILPRKFGFDKRRVHLSALIASGQISRKQALRGLEQSPYPDPEQEKQDRAYVIKKLGFSEESFEDYMRAPGVPHEQYGSEKGFYRFSTGVWKLLTKGKWAP